MNNFQPTYLYIKQHTVTGKLYFGKTTRVDPVKYPGSGTYWKLHLKVHGKKNVKTLWISDLFLDFEDLKEFALFVSEEFDIIKSDRWANLIFEDGIGGVSGMKHSTETKLKIGLAHKNKPKTADHRSKISASSKGKSKSIEHRANVSKGLTGKKQSLETHEKRANSNRGKTRSLETREKISLSRRGNTPSIESREKMAAAKRGKKNGPQSPELIAKRVEARKKNYLHRMIIVRVKDVKEIDGAEE
jgi:hypothetical protein